MKVCWTGTFVRQFERNKRLGEYLAASKVHLNVIHEDLWPEDRITAVTSSRLTIALRMLVVYPKLIFRLLRSPAPDVYLVSYPGWFDMPVVKFVALLKRRPIAFDIFISLFDTAVVDRGLVGSRSLFARFSRGFDRLSIRLSDRAIADCPAHARFLAELAGVSGDRFGVVYLGADETRFGPQDLGAADASLVLFYGTFVPLQGVEWIVRAAKHLEASGIRMRLIGDGQTRPEAEAIAHELGLTNLEFVGLMPQEELAAEIASASVLLGIFGTTPKANRVIPHKLFEAIASRRAILTGSSDAVVETFPPSEVAVCEPGSDIAIAEAIRGLFADQERLNCRAEKARSRFEEDFAVEPQGARLNEELRRTVETRHRTRVRS